MNGLMSVVGSVMSDVGCVRSANEDSARLVESAAAAGDRGWLAVVADGMGGHSAGDVASQLAVETVVAEFSWRADDPAAELAAVIRTANERVFETATSDDALSGMGTTCTAVALRDWRAHLAHVGDSRLYLIRGHDIFCLTEDDSSVMEMVRKGLLTRAEARNHEDRNVILRALGTRPELEPATWDKPLPLQAGDRLVLSTDGLHDLVDDDEIRRIVSSESHRDACSRLVDLARLRGGPDNITVVVLVVDVEPECKPVAKPTRGLEAPEL